MAKSRARRTGSRDECSYTAVNSDNSFLEPLICVLVTAALQSGAGLTNSVNSRHQTKIHFEAQASRSTRAGSARSRKY